MLITFEKFFFHIISRYHGSTNISFVNLLFKVKFENSILFILFKNFLLFLLEVSTPRVNGNFISKFQLNCWMITFCFRFVLLTSFPIRTSTQRGEDSLNYSHICAWIASRICFCIFVCRVCTLFVYACLYGVRIPFLCMCVRECATMLYVRAHIFFCMM